jgi:hypothetical protein
MNVELVLGQLEADKLTKNTLVEQVRDINNSNLSKGERIGRLQLLRQETTFNYSSARACSLLLELESAPGATLYHTQIQSLSEFYKERFTQ